MWRLTDVTLVIVVEWYVARMMWRPTAATLITVVIWYVAKMRRAKAVTLVTVEDLFTTIILSVKITMCLMTVA